MKSTAARTYEAAWAGVEAQTTPNAREREAWKSQPLSRLDSATLSVRPFQRRF